MGAAAMQEEEREAAGVGASASGAAGRRTEVPPVRLH
jgi:hypothetical protein